MPSTKLRPLEPGLHACALCPTTVGEDCWRECCGAFICETCDAIQPEAEEHEPSDHRAFEKLIEPEWDGSWDWHDDDDIFDDIPEPLSDCYQDDLDDFDLD